MEFGLHSIHLEELGGHRMFCVCYGKCDRYHSGQDMLVDIAMALVWPTLGDER